MANTVNKLQDPRQSLTPMEELNLWDVWFQAEEHFNKNRRSAIDYYGEDYVDKLFKVTGGRVLHDYVRPRFSLPRKYRR